MILHYNKDKTISFCNLHIKFHACVNKEYSKIKNYSESIHSHYFWLCSYASFYLNLTETGIQLTLHYPWEDYVNCGLGRVRVFTETLLAPVQFCFHKTLHLLSVSLVRLTLLPHKKQPKNLKKRCTFHAHVFTLYMSFLPHVYYLFPLPISTMDSLELAKQILSFKILWF